MPSLQRPSNNLREHQRLLNRLLSIEIEAFEISIVVDRPTT